jgi:iron complex outermembrane receptor protein
MRHPTSWLLAASASVLATAAQAQSAAVSGQEPAETVEEVIVTAAPYRIAADALTINVEVVTQQQLDVAPAQGIGDLLSGVPGLRSTFFGPGASRPVVRGLAGPPGAGADQRHRADRRQRPVARPPGGLRSR